METAFVVAKMETDGFRYPEKSDRMPEVLAEGMDGHSSLEEQL
jgi:hypothetical protein